MTKKILVVDDNDDAREMMAKLLELESFSVISANDGLTAINLTESECPDLIITDINMPGMDGIEMIKMLREQPELDHVPIMALTAYGGSVAAEAIKAGADHAATKPVEFNKLIDGVRRLLEKFDS